MSFLYKSKLTFLPLILTSFVIGVILPSWLSDDCLSMKLIAYKLNLHESIQFYFDEPAYSSVNVSGDQPTIHMPITSPVASTVTLTSQPPYKQGQTVLGTIVSKDDNSVPTNHGGDIYTVRVVFPNFDNSFAVQPIDHNNGTYSFFVPLFWAGIVRIEVELILASAAASYAKTLLDTEFVISQWTNEAVFKNNQMKETVLCNFDWTLNQDYCDLTIYNGMIPWYCPKPSRLPCESFTYNQPRIKLPSDYKHFSRLLSKQYGNTEVKLPVLELNVTLIEDFEFPKPPTAAEVGVSDIGPRGYFNKGHWVSLLHQNNRSEIGDVIVCIMNKHFLLFGDGNTQFPKDLFHNRLTDFDVIDLSEKNAMFYPRLNTTIQHFGHGHPISQFDSGFIFSVDEVFSRPREEVDVIIIDLWADFIFFHSDKLLLKFLQLRSYLLQWKGKYPDVEVFLRSPYLRNTPHWSHEPITFNNYNVKEANRVFKLVFKDTPFHVMDMWEMCVAFRDQHDVNPPPEVVGETLQQVVNVICPKIQNWPFPLGDLYNK